MSRIANIDNLLYNPEDSSITRHEPNYDYLQNLIANFPGRFTQTNPNQTDVNLTRGAHEFWHERLPSNSDVEGLVRRHLHEEENQNRRAIDRLRRTNLDNLNDDLRRDEFMVEIGESRRFPLISRFPPGVGDPDGVITRPDILSWDSSYQRIPPLTSLHAPSSSITFDYLNAFNASHGT